MATAKQQRDWLRRLAIAMLAKLERDIPHHVIKIRDAADLFVGETDTHGWSVTLGTTRAGTRGYLDIWLDRYSGTRARRVSFALAARQTAYVQTVAENLEGASGERFSTLTYDDLEQRADGSFRIVDRVAPLVVGRRVAELYRESEWSWLTFYHPQAPDFSRPPSAKLISSGALFFQDLLLAIVGTTTQHNEDFRELTNRSKVRQHIVRERSAAAARAAKLRDSYTCKVCGFNFSQTYGKLGDGFAEACCRSPKTDHLCSVRIDQG